MGWADRLRRPRRGNDWFLQRELLVPTPDTLHALGSRTLEPDEEISFVVVPDEVGRLVLPAFTSEIALNRWRPHGSHYVALNGEVLIDLLAASDWDGMVIDGADANSYSITRADARRLVGETRLSLPAGSTVRIGQPARAAPDGLVRALVKACENAPAVSAAYLYQVQHVEFNEEPHLAVGLRLPAGEKIDPDLVVRSIAQRLEPARWGYEFVDIHVLEGDLLEMVRATGPPVFGDD